MPALTADAHNPDGVLAGRPLRRRLIATFVHKHSETVALVAGTRDLRVLATVFLTHRCCDVHVPAFQHYVELLNGVPMVKLVPDVACVPLM